MSKVVKSVGRAVGKVVKGVTNVVKKVAKSPIGKALLIAGTVYFGGAALMGGLNTIGTSTSFLSGMSSGLSSAASGISGAWGALTGTGGGGIGAAGEALKTGFMGGSPWTQTATGLNVLAGDAAAAGAGAAAGSGGSGLISGMMASKYAAPALISTAGQLIGAGMQARGAEKAQEAAEEDKQKQLATYNTNVGTRLWG